MNQIKILPLLLCLFCFNLQLLNASVADEVCLEETAATELIMMCQFTAEAIMAPGGSLGDVCAGAVLTLYAGQGCDSRLYMDIYLVNLLPVGQSPNQGVTYSLPGGMPDMYVHYDSDLDGIKDKLSGPINQFTFEGDQTTGLSGQPYFIYKHRLPLEYYPIVGCPANYPGGQTGPMAVDLLELKDDGFQLYDLLPHSAFNGTVSCDVFHETCGHCLHSCTTFPPSYAPVICIDCINPCTGSERENNEDEWTQIEQASTLSLASINPNPFQDEVMVNYYTNQEEAIELAILDVTGALVQQMKLPAAKGEQTQILDLSALPAGVYYCQIKSSNEMKTLKMLKSGKH